MREQNNTELLYAKLDDKIKFCKTKNKITHTDFFTEPEILKIKKYFNSINFNNYIIWGENENLSRKIILFFPDKLTFDMAYSNINKILEIIRINLPNSQKGTLEHKDYLSAIMKFGIIREKFGDIIVYQEGADIIVQKENSNYFKVNLNELIRFRKANIEILDISNLHENTLKTEKISIIVNSMRIDNFITEICHCSRNKAEEILLQERVMINYEKITKNSKTVNTNDIITIRGVGRFIVKELARKTKSDKNIIILEHYI